MSYNNQYINCNNHSNVTNTKMFSKRLTNLSDLYIAFALCMV